MKIISKARHRNGVMGDPFNVVIFEDDDGSTKIAVDFGEVSIAVLQLYKIISGDIAFGSNSWRGDHYAKKIRDMTTLED